MKQSGLSNDNIYQMSLNDLLNAMGYRTTISAQVEIAGLISPPTKMSYLRVFLFKSKVKIAPSRKQPYNPSKVP